MTGIDGAAMTGMDGAAGMDPMDGAAGMDRMDGAAGVDRMDGAAAPDALRQLIREVLRDVLPSLTDQAVLEDQPPPVPPTSVPRADPARPGADGLVAADSRAAARADSSVARADSSVARADSRVARAAAVAAGSLQAVRLSTDEELHAFVLHVLRLADNPKRRRDILAGRLRFTLAGGTSGTSGTGRTYGAGGGGDGGAGGGGDGAGGGHPVPAVIHRVDRGAVTERAVIAAARAGARLVLGPRAVLTPLARDKARALAVPVEKER